MFKKLQHQILERYPDKLLLKDRLFHGMNQHLKDSLRYLYTQSSVTYANLFQAAYAAEVEVEKGRAAQSKAANLTNSPDKVDIRSRDPSQIVASVAAIESKLDKCLKSVSKAAQAPSHKTESSEQGGQHLESNLAPVTPTEYRGPTSAGGPFKGKNGKPIHCWCCGGWGHTTRECPTQGNLNWRELSGPANPPKETVRPAQNK